MSQINVSLCKKEVLRDVWLTTSYAGAKAENPTNCELFDRVTTVEEDADLLNKFWIESCSRMSDLLKDFTRSVSFDDESLQMLIAVSTGFDMSLSDSIVHDIRKGMVAQISAAWFQITLPERAADRETEWQKTADSLRSKLYHRRAPRRGGVVKLLSC